MKRKGQGMILTIFVGVIIGLVALTVIGSVATSSTDTVTVTDETQTLSTSSNASTTNDRVVSVDEITVYGNYSGGSPFNQTLATSNYTVYNLDSRTGPALIELNEPKFDGNTSYVDYTYKPSGYVESSTTRTLITFIPLIFAAAILIFVAGFISMRK